MCGKKTDDYYKWAVALWCPTCRKEVDKELRKEQDKPFAFYFAKYKVIEKKGTRIFCIPCRKEVDKWLALIRRMKKKKESV